MKKTILILISLVFLCIAANAAAMSDGRANQIADAIFKLENSAKYPYGIKSIDTHGDAKYARVICIKTIKNNWLRWQKTNQKESYLTFLANRYCPPSADPKGNANWIKNINLLINKK